MKLFITLFTSICLNAFAATEAEPEIVLTDKGVIVNGQQKPSSSGVSRTQGRIVKPSPSWGWGGKKVNSDAVISKRSRKIVFEKTDKPEMSLDGVLFFGKEEINVGPVTWGTDDASVTLSKEVFAQVALKHTGEVGKLNMRVGNDMYFKDEVEGVRVFIAGHDEDCRNPVYLTDHDGTISSHDQCTTESVDHIIDSKNGTFFVISSAGSSMKDRILSANYKNKDRILVLGKSSPGNWGASEKALRVFTYFANSGACIAGFAGDMPTIDGEAARTLNVPYFAVNQREEEEAEMTSTTKKVCALTNELRFSYEMTVVGDKKCGPGYKEHESRTEIECKKTNMYSQSLTNNKTYWVEKPGFLGLGGGPGCYVGDEETGAKRDVRLCRRPQPFEMGPNENGECEANYVLEDRQVVNRRITGYKPNINIQEFPEGSVWSKSWCELVKKMDSK